jgi:hypothetical protein
VTQVLQLLKLTPKVLDVVTDLSDSLPSPLLRSEGLGLSPTSQ